MTARQGTAVILGGTAGIGRELAERLAADGMSVVVSGRDAARAQSVAAEIGPSVTGIALDLAEPATLRDALAGVGQVDALIIAAIERDANLLRTFRPGHDWPSRLWLIHPNVKQFSNSGWSSSPVRRSTMAGHDQIPVRSDTAIDG